MTAPRREEWNRVREVFEAALGRPSDARQSFVADSCRDEPAIRDQVMALLASHDHAGTFLESPAVGVLGAVARAGAPDEGPDPNIGRVIGPYCIESRLGHGGMGTVYLARRADLAFERRVAIKMIRRGMHSDLVVQRFEHERQILASLDHPHIARLYDGGTTPEGLPYFVMEYVEGEPITDYCQRHRLGTRARLSLFRTVCDAVQYAHQNLVIHRDLKPANILVGADGQPRLLDFGIAKLLAGADVNEPAGATLAALTPDYASPEQMRGRTMTTATDVYSLGVVLYELLAGRRPFTAHSASLEDVVRSVCETDPPPPSAVRENGDAPGSIPLPKELRGDLDTIVLKALRKEPEQRYASVEQFSEDVRRHLERVPIAARKASARYRAGRFLARHKVGVAAAALILLAILSGTAAAAWQARIARQQAEIARLERARAERRFNDLRKLANSMIFELHDSIEDLPGATAARKLVVDRAIEYLDSLAQESRSDSSLQREVADSYKRIGDLQGAPYTANVGDTPAAIKSYEQALSIRQALLASNPDSLADVIGFAQLSGATANAFRSSGNSSAALEHTQRAVRTLEAARRSHPDDLRLLQELMRAYGAEANLYASFLVTTNVGTPSDALPLRRKQLEIAERLYEMAPGDQEMTRSLASALTGTADQLLMMGQRRQAADHVLRARQLLLKLTDLSTSRTSLFALHDNYYRMVSFHHANGELELSRTAARQALEIAEQLVAADAENAQARLVLAADLANVAEVSALTGRQDEGRAALAKAMSVDAELVRQYPKTSQFRNMRYHRWLAAGNISLVDGSYLQALRYYNDARDILRAMSANDPKNRGSRLRLAFVSNATGSVLLRLRDVDAASQAYHDALNLVGAPPDAALPDEDSVYAVADAHAGLGAVEAARAAGLRNRAARIAHLRQALASIDRSLELWQQAKEPGLLSPSGFDVTPVHEVRNRRERISAELATLDAAVK